MTQSCVFLYIILILGFSLIYFTINNIRKFFFYSEVLWMFLFLCFLNMELFLNTTIMLNTSIFILILTAMEGVLFACILLIYSKSLRTGTWYGTGI